MRRFNPCTLLLSTVVLALPLRVQGNINVAYFVTIEGQHGTEFEEALMKHNQWHGSQNDTWAGAGPQALGGE